MLPRRPLSHWLPLVPIAPHPVQRASHHRRSGRRHYCPPTLPPRTAGIPGTLARYTGDRIPPIPGFTTPLESGDPCLIVRLWPCSDGRIACRIEKPHHPHGWVVYLESLTPWH